jgi:hypothetical protein
LEKIENLLKEAKVNFDSLKETDFPKEFDKKINEILDVNKDFDLLLKKQRVYFLEKTLPLLEEICKIDRKTSVLHTATKGWPCPGVWGRNFTVSVPGYDGKIRLNLSKDNYKYFTPTEFMDSEFGEECFEGLSREIIYGFEYILSGWVNLRKSNLKSLNELITKTMSKLKPYEFDKLSAA